MLPLALGSCKDVYDATSGLLIEENQRQHNAVNIAGSRRKPSIFQFNPGKSVSDSVLPSGSRNHATRAPLGEPIHGSACAPA